MKNSLNPSLLLLVGLASGIASAQDLVLTTTVGVDAFYDDQFDLQVEDTETTAIAYRPAMQFAYTGQRYQSVATIGATYNQFVDAPYENTENFNAGWDLTRTGESSTLALNARYIERLVADVVEFDDAARIAGNNRVTTINFGPRFSTALSSRSNLDLSYQYASTTVDDAAELDNDDNVQHNLNALWSRVITPRSTFALSADFLAFRPQNPDVQLDVDANVYGLAIGGLYQLNERWQLEGTVGLNQVDIDEDTANAIGQVLVVEDGEVLFAGNVTASYVGLQNDLDISLIAGTTQQLDGVVDEQRSIDIGWQRRINDELSSVINGRYFDSDRNDRSNYTFGASLNWQPALRWTYNLRYGYREQSLTTDELVAEELNGSSNRISLTVEYTFDDLRFDI